jgi:ubiquitin-conjugating enzyme E2 J2
MGEKERGKPDLAQEPQLQSSASTNSSLSLCSVPNHTAPLTTPGLTADSSSRETQTPINGSLVRQNSNVKPEDLARQVAPGWQKAWRFVYEKWRLCAFIALAVMVSRFSTRG